MNNDLQPIDRYHCNHCMASYSVTVRTLFHKTKIDLQKWFFAIPLVIDKKVSARQLARCISVTKDTACFMVMRIKQSFEEQPEHIKNIIESTGPKIT